MNRADCKQPHESLAAAAEKVFQETRRESVTWYAVLAMIERAFGPLYGQCHTIMYPRRMNRRMWWLSFAG